MKRVLALVAVGAFVATCVGLGIWQLSRLADKRAANRQLLARAALPVVDVAAALDDAPDAAAQRRVRARGTYDTERELVLLSRSYRGISGHHVVTPLVLAGGRAILVDRGWVPLTANEPPVAGAAPPGGEVVVAGTLQPSATRGRFGPQDPPATSGQTFRIDTAVLATRFPYPIEPLFLQLEAQEPATAGEHPIIVEPPPLDEGPHLAYAIQWFLFAVAAVVTVAAVARARARRGRVSPRTSAARGPG